MRVLAQRRFDVFEHGEVGEQRAVLEHDAEARLALFRFEARES